MPLKSYIDNKKDIKNGIKCPQEKEELIRAHVLKEALEKIGCSKDKLDKVK